MLMGALVLVGISACGPSSAEPLALDVRLEAARTTVAPGDTIAFVVTAQGGNLFGVELDYGDSTTVQYATGGARTARVTFRHAYLTRGTYTARAVATDALAGQKDASLEIRVN